MQSRRTGPYASDTREDTPDWRARTTLTVEEAAVVLGISRASAYQSAKRGDLPVLDFGRRKVVPVVRLRKLLGEEVGGTA
jgi:excisionase family DNA binding protein